MCARVCVCVCVFVVGVSCEHYKGICRKSGDCLLTLLVAWTVEERIHKAGSPCATSVMKMGGQRRFHPLGLFHFLCDGLNLSVCQKGPS